MMVFNGAIDGDKFFKGGLHWQSLVYALWESFLCISMCIGLIYLFRRYLNRQGRLAGFLAPNAYTAYIIHAQVITATALALRNVDLYPLLKFGLAALIARAAVFCAGQFDSQVCRIPIAFCSAFSSVAVEHSDCLETVQKEVIMPPGSAVSQQEPARRGRRFACTISIGCVCWRF